MSNFEFILLEGGPGVEREVSFRSAKNVFDAFPKKYKVKKFQLDAAELPRGLDPHKHIIFPVLHGDFGEDGQLQKLLESQNFVFVGSDAQSSALCMDKEATKRKLASKAVRVPEGMVFSAEHKPDVDQILQQLGTSLFLKPRDKGSSIGVQRINGREELQQALGQLKEWNWLLEEEIFGRDITVGVVDGKAAELTEYVLPNRCLLDYKCKYSTETAIILPKDIEMSTRKKIQRTAELIFHTCCCRDLARIDFLLQPNGKFYFLEANTLPGMTQKSSFPISVGLPFTEMIYQIIQPSIVRFRECMKGR